MPKIIAVCGYKRSGKDTIANLIGEIYGYKHVKIASKLKEVTKTLFAFTDDQIESDTKDTIDPRWGVSPRHVMQFVGTEMFQYKLQELLSDVKRNFWIKGLLASLSENDRVIISDLRFLHEYEELKKHNVFVIRVNRPGITCGDDAHISEKEYTSIPVDLEIVNTNMKDLRNLIMYELFNQTE